MATQVEIVVDRGPFSGEVVARAAHRFTGVCFVEIAESAAGFVVRLCPRNESEAETEIAQRFKNELLDERIRESVREETRELHIALVQAALKGASSNGGS